MKLDTKAYEERMKKTIEALRQEFVVIRAGRANPEILARVHADYYGVPTPITQMAQISMPDARTLQIQPWDAQSLKLIERAILASDIGITPISDGRIIRLAFQPPTEERRKDLQKQVAKFGEEAKVAIRNIRRDANEKSKDLKKNSEMTEDEQKQSDKIVQDMTDKYIKDIDNMISEKNKEILAI